MSFYKIFIKPALFLFNPERAHHITFFLLKVFCRIPGFRFVLKSVFNNNNQSEVLVAGIHFPNKVGLAAGLDKDAKMVDEFCALGFGFVEIGTVTPLPQPGNDKPRLFRLPKDNALINRMGFNNEGVVAAAKRLKEKKSGIIVGGNIGKNKITANEKAGDDYEKCFRELFDVVDYFVVNVSSPNTPGLRELQEKEPLTRLLMRLQKVNGELGEGWQKSKVKSQKLEVRSQKVQESRKPIFLKIAPDLTNAQLDEIIEVVKKSCIDGIVATNTTIARKNLLTLDPDLDKIGSGGLSGKPLEKRATDVIRYLHQQSKGTIPIIGVGGIHSAEDAMEKLNAGASLIQLYTGFIYEGPSLVQKINKAIAGIK